MITIKPKAQARREQQNKGFTLTEIAIVLGIIGLILGAIWTAAAGVYSSQRVNHATSATLQIVQGVRTLFASSSTTGYTTAGDMTTTLISAGAVPGDLVNSANNTLTGPFPGGNTAIIATIDANGQGTGFVVAMSNVSRSNCINLLAAIGGSSRDPGLYEDDAVATAAPSVSDGTAVANPLQTTVSPVIAAEAVASNPGPYGGCVSGTTMFKVRFGFTLK